MSIGARSVDSAQEDPENATGYGAHYFWRRERIFADVI